MYNQHSRGMETTRHRSLVERGGRKAFVRDLTHTHTQIYIYIYIYIYIFFSETKTDIHESKRKDSST